MRTFDTGQLMPQLAKARDHGIVLHAFSPLAAKPPAIGKASVLGAVAAHAPRGALAPHTKGRAGWPQMDRIRAPSEDGRDGRVWGARIFLDRRGDGDALRDHQGDRVDSDGDGAAPVLHPRGNGAVLESRKPGRRMIFHGCRGLRIVIHDLLRAASALVDRCQGQAAGRLA